MSGFSRGKLEAGRIELGLCTARYESKSCFEGIAMFSRRVWRCFVRGSCEISLVSSLHRASTDALIYHKNCSCAKCGHPKINMMYVSLNAVLGQKANQTTPLQPGQLFPEKGKKSCPRWGFKPTTLCALASRRALYQLSYQDSSAGRGSNLQHNTIQRQASNHCAVSWYSHLCKLENHSTT